MPRTYTNPLVDRYFADPFVLRTGEGYFAYATQLHADGECAIPVLHSRDLVSWEDRGPALTRLDLPDARDYWAPEVAEHDGHYYLYYTAGVEDRGHRIRVASSDRPDGPFKDHGRVLTGEDPFTIDAHPFRDEDGQWYLFYARDFLDGERAGTALVVDRLVTMDALEGSPRTVLRASADWQLYGRGRRMYGAVYDWHTLEGPFVVRRNGRYYCLYSGGSWRTETYGVSWAEADEAMGPYREPETDAPRLLRTVPGRVLGPGHCSVVTGPDGADYIVYHAWDADGRARRMHLDRLEWTPDGPRCAGPTWTPQPAPMTPVAPAR